MKTYTIDSKNIFRAYKESHIGEAAAAGSEVTASDIVKDIMKTPTPFLTREIGVFYEVSKGQNNVIVPKMGAVTATTLTTGDYGAVGNAVFTFATITVNQDYGVNLQWDRGFAEKANWEVMGPFVSEGVRACEERLMGTICNALNANASGTVTLTNPLTWAQITAGMTSLAVNNFNCDVVIMHPTQYGQLLQLQQFVDASYMGSDRNIKTGIIDTELGAKFIRTTKCPTGTILFIDSTKALGAGMARDGKVEEYAYPDVNKYGVVISEVYGVAFLNTGSCVKGTI
jgi:hypothetical protein